MDQQWTITNDETETTDLGDGDAQTVTDDVEELTSSGSTCEADKPTLGDASIVNVPVKVR